MDGYSSAHQQFERALGIRESMRNSPRFGNTREFADLFDDGKQSDYVAGILITALIISVIFLCWALFLCIMKCMGKERVGFLSGGPYDATLGEKREPNPRPLRGRFVFGISGVLFITFTFLLLFLGFANLEETTNELADGAKLGSEIFGDTRSLLIQFLVVAKEAAATRDVLVEVLQDAFETGQIGYNGTLINGTLPPVATATAKFIVDDIDFREEATQIVDSLYALDSMVQGQSQELNAVIDDGEGTCNDVADGLDEVEVRSLQLAFGIPYTIFPFIMLVFMGMAIMGVNNSGKDFCISICFMPMFVFLVILLVVMTAGFSIGGIVNADFCSGGEGSSPDDTLLLILDYKGVDKASIEYRVIEYLVQGCEFDTPEDEFPLEFIQAFEARLGVTETSISRFRNDLQTVGVSALQETVKDVDLLSIDERLDAFKENVEEMLRLLELTLKELACQRLYEVYSKVIHEATCDTNYYALAWTFAAFLVMSFSGMMMIMFRAALYPLAGGVEDDFSWNEVKEQEGLNEGDPVPNDEVPAQSYVADEGLTTIPNPDSTEEAPMGGEAQQRYESVGDDNPFEDGK